ncbi:IclR family transcriptional regulator [Nocardia colli]|uniref:IclR family transcriptional regulator n=1 Tax=Nocardia colli TaxID=2545717 RepID=UPI0035DF1968
MDKALTVLDVLREADRAMRLSEIARRACLAKSTTHRLIGVLVSHRMVAGNGGAYLLGDRMQDRRVVVPEQEARSLRAVMMPFLIDLYNLTHGTVYLAVPGEGGMVKYLASLFGHNSIRTPSRSREWAPAHCTAAGKILLSEQCEAADDDSGRCPAPGNTVELSDIRRAGLAHNWGEYVPGVACIAIGIPNSAGVGRAAIAVSDGTDRLNPTSTIGHLRRIGFASAVAAQQVLR